MKNSVTKRRSSLKKMEELSRPNSGMKPTTVILLCFISCFIGSNFCLLLSSSSYDTPATSTHSTPINQKEPTINSTENHLRSKKQRSKTLLQIGANDGVKGSIGFDKTLLNDVKFKGILVEGRAAFPPPPTCTQEQLLAVRHQLPPELCLIQEKWLQACSLTTATKCPKATWLDHHYLELQKRHFANGGATRNMSTAQQGASSSFLGISVGCNKGFDAINTLRMGTFDGSINKADWKAAMEHDGAQLHASVCNQDEPKDVFQVVAGSDDHQKQRPHGEMHCIEPMPQTFKRLHHAAKALGYMDKGFTVTNAAVSKITSDMFFPADGKEGVENMGLESCNNPIVRQEHCKLIPVFSLKDFVDQKVQAPKSDPINILTVDVEGFDGDVLLGATSEVLKRVEYLEFEYNWMGSWKRQHLHDIVQMLDETADMTCYWAGIDRLWRVTNCWMAYFDSHTWSNVACVNRRLVPSMASEMEELFEHTLSETDKQWMDARFKNSQHLAMVREEFRDHVLLSTAPEQLAKPYHQ